jgi:hypothetical protein
MGRISRGEADLLDQVRVTNDGFRRSHGRPAEEIPWQNPYNQKEREVFYLDAQDVLERHRVDDDHHQGVQERPEKSQK